MYLLRKFPALQSLHSGLWYFNSLRVPGSLDVAGASVPGVPFVLLGRNRDISWGLTAATHSGAEGITVASSGTTEDEKEVEDVVTVREEVIAVRGEAEPIVHFARYTASGPVISDHFSPVVAGAVATHLPQWRYVALRAAALRPFLSISFLQQLNEAANFEEFTKAAQACSHLALNFVYADKLGNIGLVSSTR